MSRNHIQTHKANKQGLEAMSTAVAATYIRKMVDKETTGNGDLDNAMRRLARRYNLSFWQISHLRGGRAKAITIDAFMSIRSAYLDFCARQIADLQAEIEREKASYGDEDFEDLAAEAEALAAKIEAARKGR